MTDHSLFRNIRATIFPALAVLALALPSQAVAASITFNLNQDGCGGTGGCTNGGSAGTVTITDGGTPGAPDNGLDTNEVNVSFALASGYLFSNSASKGRLSFNLSGTPAITIDDLNGTGADGTTDTTSDFNLVSGSAGSLKTPPFGDFEYAIVCNVCQGGQTSNPGGTVSWDVVLTGITISSFVANDSGYFFATDVLGPATGNTGDVGAKGPDTPPALVTPEPTSLLLLGSGLLLGVKRFRRKLN